MSIEPSELDADELQQVVEGVIAALYKDPDTGEVDPNLEWDSDTPSNVAEVLRNYGLVPGQEPEDEEVEMSLFDTIGWLEGMGDGGDDDMGRECAAMVKTLKALQAAGREVCDSEDNTGCDVGITVADRNAVARLNNIVYPEHVMEEELGDPDDE
jgi:hypothetical protein